MYYINQKRHTHTHSHSPTVLLSNCLNDELNEWSPRVSFKMTLLTVTGDIKPKTTEKDKHALYVNMAILDCLW